uniref:HMG box domain-containing protein n=1 Tax=Panagrolaimus davidi TaxID=227884 RepID=A0A914R3Y7_9BILA
MFIKGFRFTNLLFNEIKSIKSSAINPTTKNFPANYISPTTFAIYIQENIKKTPLTKSEFSRLSTEWKLLSNEEKEVCVFYNGFFRGLLRVNFMR